MFENVLPGMAHNAWNEGVTTALRFGAGGPAFGMPGFGTPFAILGRHDATPYATEIYNYSQKPVLPYEDPGRSKFLEIQKMEWEYQSPHMEKLPVKGDFDWFEPTSYKPIIPKPIKQYNVIPDYLIFKPIEFYEPPIVKEALDRCFVKPYEPIKLYEAEPIKPLKSSINENPFLQTLPTDFAFQPIKTDNDLFPKRGGMHDSFNVSPYGDIFNGHTTIELKGGLKTRLPW